MHLSMHNWMRREPLEATARRLAAHGYESLEIMGEPDLHDTRHVSEVLDDHGLRCWGAVTMMEDGRSLVAADERVRHDSVAYARSVVTMAKELEGEVVTVVPAEIGRVTPESTVEQEWEWAVEGLRAVYADAQAAGLRLAIEPINRYETHFVTRLADALALATAVGPDCGVCLDTFHVNIEEAGPYEAFLEAGERLADVHVADTNQLACGMGHWDWHEVIASLRAVGYDGALAVEFVPRASRTPVGGPETSLERREGGAPEVAEADGTVSEAVYESLVEECARTLLPLIR